MRKRKILLGASRLGSLGLIVGLFLLFSIRMPRVWLTTYNLMNLLEQTVSLGLCAMGMSIVRAAGETDLSLGSVAGLASVVSVGWLLANKPVPIAILVGLALGALIGLANGFMRTVLRIPGVLPTIGTGSIAGGLALIYSGGGMIFGSSPALNAFLPLGLGYIGPIPIPALVLAGVAAVVWTVLNKTRLGRVLYMVGGNPEASRLSGVAVNREVLLAYTLCGLSAAGAGVMLSARVGAGNPIGGADFVLDSLIAVTVGSTVLAEEQEVSPLGSLLGALFVTLVQTGLQMMGQGNQVMCVLRGVLLLAALGLFSLRKRALE